MELLKQNLKQNAINQIKLEDPQFVDDVFYSKLDKPFLLSGKMRYCNEYYKISSNELGLEFVPWDEDNYETLNLIEEYLVDYLHKNSVRIFEHDVDKDKISDLLISCIKTHNSHNSYLKVQIDDGCLVSDKLGKIDDLINLKDGFELKVRLKVDRIEFHPDGYELIILCDRIYVTRYFCPTDEYLFGD